MLRGLLTAIARLRRFVPQRWRRDGVIALPFTTDGRIVLVRHRYIEGWYPPGGGRKRRETPATAALRELREEIGLTGHSTIARLADDAPRLAVFLLRDVRHAPRRSLEIAAIAAFDPDDLPDDTSPRLRRILSGSAARQAAGLGPAA